MLIKLRGGDSVLDDELSAVAKIDGRGWQELRVQRIELFGMLIRPQGETRRATDHLEGVLEGVYDVISGETVGGFSQTGHFGHSTRN